MADDLNPGYADEQAGVIRWGESTRTVGPAFRAMEEELRRLAAEANEQHPVEAAFAEAMRAQAAYAAGLAEIAEELPEAVRVAADAYFDAFENPRFGSRQRESRADSGPAADGQ